MDSETGTLEVFSAISSNVRFRWTMGEMKQLIGAPKKQLRKALRAIESPEARVKVFRKGKETWLTFHHGFRKFRIHRKKKEREISEPHPDIQEVYVAIKDWLEGRFSSHYRAYGFVRERNCKRAALSLLENKHFLTLDIANAFPSVTTQMVKQALISLGVSETLAESLSWLTTFSQGCLPQGSSSSPLLLNLVFLPMCGEIDEFCEANNLRWAVYVDDFTFAGKDISEEMKQEILRIPEKFGFRFKKEKTKDNRGKTIPHMLGLTIVDGKVHIRRGRKKEYRRIFHEALRNKDFNPKKAAGLANYIRCIYGPEEHWPGWLRRPWEEYQITRRKDDGI